MIYGQLFGLVGRDFCLDTGFRCQALAASELPSEYSPCRETGAYADVMAKIKKQLPRRLAPAPSAVMRCIDLLTSASDEELVNISKQLHTWCHPKSDFYHWIPVLNRFDSILESAMPSATKDKPYTVASDGFGPGESGTPTKDILIAVLNITKHLWETCTNRNLYNSFEHLIELLNTRDLDILTAALRLMLRPAQRISAQRSMRSTLLAAHERLMVLSQNLGGASDISNLSQTYLPMGTEPQCINFQFYRVAPRTKKTTSETSASASADAAATTTAIAPSTTTSGTPSNNLAAAQQSSTQTLPSTPSSVTPSSGGVSTSATPVKVSKLSTKLPTTPSNSDKKGEDPSSEGLVVIQIPDITALGSSEKAVLQKLVQQYEVPEEHIYGLFHRIRVAFSAQDTKSRHALLLCRILAVGTVANLVSEDIAAIKIFASDPTVIHKLVDVLQADCTTDLHVAALLALESLARYRTKQNEILTAMNASANHGVLMYLVRKMTSKLSEDVSESNQDFMDAVTACILYVITTQAGGNMVISAGLVPALVGALSVTDARQLKNVSKIVGILDSLLYGFANSFTPFANANGLTLLTDRIKEEVAKALELAGVKAVEAGGMEVDDAPIELPYERTSLLRAMLKFVLHMMQTSGGADGLRNLIDSSLPSSLIVIFDHSMLFGANVFGLAANIMATFIHNEATVLSILQEAKLPQSFLEAVKSVFPVSAEVVSAIPNALGALCLNEQGLNAVLEANVFDRFCSVFTDEQYQTALHDGEVPHLVGNSFDELMRHTPALKPQVMEAVVKMLKTVVEMGHTMHVEDEGGNINLMVSKGSPETASAVDTSETLVPTDASGDVSMTDAPVLTLAPDLIVNGVRDDVGKETTRDSKISQFIETISRFVEGILQTQEHGAKLIELGALPTLLEIFSLPSVPYDFGSSSASYSLSYLFRIIIEIDTKAVVEALLAAIRRSLSRLAPFLEYDGGDAMVSHLIELYEANPEQVCTASSTFRSLVEIHGYMKLLSDVYGNHTIGPAKAVAAIVHTFANKESEGMLKALLHLQSVCSWEHTLLRKSVPKSWFQPKNKRNADKAAASLLGDAADQAAAASSQEGTASTVDESPDGKEKDAKTDKKARNVRLFAFLLSRISTLLGPIFFGIVKLVTARRIADTNHRKSAYKVIDTLVTLLVDGLSWARAMKDDSTQTVQFLTMAVARLTHVLSDDRQGPTLQTSAAFAFNRANGMEKLLKVAEYLWNKVEKLPPADDKVVMTKENTDPSILVLQDVLEIVKLLTHHKALHESPHTPNLALIYSTSSETPFLAHELLIQTRLAVLPHILTVWRSELLIKVPASLTRLVVNILMQTLKAGGESTSASATTLPNGTSVLQSFANSIFAAPTQVAPDADRVQQLVDMGFPRGAAETALTRYGNNISRATDYLIAHPELVAAERARPTTNSSTSATAAATTTAGVAATDNTGTVQQATETLAAEPPSEPLSEPPSDPLSEPPSEPPSDPMSQDHTEEEQDEDDDAAELAAALAMSVQPRPGTDPIEAISDAQAATSSSVPPHPADDKGKIKVATSSKVELDAMRAEALKDAVDRALALLAKRDSAIFEIKDILLFCAADNLSTWVGRVTEGISLLITSMDVPAEVACVKARGLRLLALLLNETGAAHDVVLEAVKPFVKEFLAHTDHVVVNEGSTAWLPPTLLIAGQYITQSEEPRKVKLAPELVSRDADLSVDATQPLDQLSAGERSSLLSLMVRLLRNETILPKQLLSAVLPIVVQLTRKTAEAISFVQAGGLAALFQSDRIALVGEQPAMTLIVLRNIIENPDVLLMTMERELKVWFGSPRTRTIDISGYLRAVAGIASRDPDTFIKATENVAQLIRYDPSARQQQITLQSKPTPESATINTNTEPTGSGNAGVSSNIEVEAGTNTEMNVGASSSNIAVDQSVVGYLVTELLAMRPSMLKIPNDKPDTKKQAYRRRTVLLQCLSELVSSYPVARVAALGVSTEPEVKASPSPNGSAFLSYLVDELVPNAVKAPEGDNPISLSDEVMESCWGLTLLQELCGGSINDIDKEGIDDALDVAVRKVTLEAIRSSIADIVSQADITRDDRYSLFALFAELVDRILMMRVIASDRTGRLGSRSSIEEENPNSLTRIMLDKGFVGILTGMISEIDVYHPKAKLVVSAVLKPIETLTKAASRVPKPVEVTTKGPIEGGAAVAEEAIPMHLIPEGVSRDMPVDNQISEIYRNSALGIFNADHRPDQDMSEDSEEDSEDRDEDESEGDYDEFDEQSDAEMIEDGEDIDGGDQSSNPDDDMEIAVPYHHQHNMGDSEDDENDELGDHHHHHHHHEPDAVIEVIDGDDHGNEEDWEDEGDEAADEDDVYPPEEMEVEGFEGVVPSMHVDHGEEHDHDDDQDDDSDENDDDDDDEGGPMVDGEDGEETEEEELLTTYPPMDPFDLEAPGPEDFEALEMQGNRPLGGMAGRAGGPGRMAARLLRRVRRLPNELNQDRFVLDWGDRSDGGDGAFGFPGLTGALPRGPTRNDDRLTHPLLLNEAEIAQNERLTDPRGLAARGRGRLGDLQMDFQAFDELVGGQAIQLLQQIFGRVPGGLPDGRRMRAQAVVETVPQGGGIGGILGVPGLPQPPFLITNGTQNGTPGSIIAGIVSSTSLGTLAVSAESEQDSIIRSYNVASTSERWTQQARILYRSNYTDRALRLQNRLLNALIPVAAEEQRRRKEKETEARRIQEETERVEAEKRRQEEEEAAAAKAAKEAEEAAEKRRLEEEAATAVAAQQVTASSCAQETVPMEADDSTLALASSATREHQPSTTETPRTIVTIHGRDVDITGTGIDPEFLEALPDDMRQEVVTQHLRESRRQARSSTSAAPDSINPEFLNALPPDIRQEILEQERREAERAQRSQSGTTAAQPGGPIEMDPATFLATLDPDLRQNILLEQDDVFLSRLPPGLLAEATQLRERLHRTRHAQTLRTHRTGGSAAPVVAEPAKKRPVGRDVIQVLDRSQLSMIIRLLFLPEPVNGKNLLLHKILANLAENAKTRLEIVSLLLSLLADGSGDLTGIERSFSLSSRSRGKQPVTPKPAPQNAPMSPTTPSAQATSHSLLINLPESSATTVAVRCLEALTYLIQFNIQTAHLFLMESEAFAQTFTKSSRLTLSHRKGKGKEKAVQKLPVLVLFSLLERKAFLNDSNIMESLMNLLALVVRPFAILGKKAASSITGSTNTTSTEPNVDVAAPQNTSTGASAVAGQAAAATSEARSAATSNEPESSNKPEASTTTDPRQAQINLIEKLVIPEQYIQATMNVLTAGECSSKTFASTLQVIQLLAGLGDNRQTMAGQAVASAQQLGDSMLGDLEELCHILKSGANVMQVQAAILSKLSASSSQQAKLLRLLKTIDVVFSKKPTESGDSAGSAAHTAVGGSNEIGATTVSGSIGNSSTSNPPRDEEKVDKDTLISIYDQLNFSRMWARLGDVLNIIDQTTEYVQVATVLLPLIEAFMVVSKPYVLKRSAATRASALPMPAGVRLVKEPSNVEENETFLKFTGEHRKILNVMVRNNPSLMNGSFSLLIHNPNVLEFDNKRTYFNQQLHKRTARDHYGSLQINVRRAYVFDDSYHQLQRHNGDEIKYGKLSVRFVDEEGVDAGGVTREWFGVLTKQMFNPNYALFRPSAADKVTYQPNRSSWINPEHLSLFKFVGRIIGKAIYDGKLLECYFTRAFYKAMLEVHVDWRDMEAIDPDFHKSLEWMLNNDITSVLDLNFCTEIDDFGKTKIVDLKPNGQNIPVTEENKQEYVRLITEQKLVVAIKDQIQAFLSGFHEVISKDLIKIFNEQELELLISGMPDIDIDDMKANTEYVNYTPSSPQIQWFWRAVRSFSQEERAKLVQFVTGTSKVPLEGFAALQGSNGVQKFQIHRDFANMSSNNRLPSAHTCFNQIDLPGYDSYENLRSNLLLAISECGTGFGFA
ncbi:hypothetical protein SeLEV6574_g01357 [Synchytrium endobioticum]|uniref:HECT-type E3 ubiquitin transferase n=1 Tax=Synchytrium endobioticum TaxID=286115 RepID=A0A507DFF9_9FUNG|nr:hypothetical protein SeLEV6574_g01357 [Synchytrium endobioticum]